MAAESKEVVADDLGEPDVKVRPTDRDNQTHVYLRLVWCSSHAWLC